MSEFKLSGRNYACPVCGRQKPDCKSKEQENVVFCHTYIDNPGEGAIPGYRYVKPTKDKVWGIFVSDAKNSSGKLTKGRKIRTGSGRSQFYYHDRDGNPFLKVEKVKAGEEKQFYQYHWDGEWKSGVPDRIKPDIPIYRYTEVRAAIAQGKPIIVVEGESAADALWRVGLACTTFLGGASKLDSYGKHYKQDLEGADLYLCPDRDKLGVKHMKAVAELFPGTKLIHCYPKSPVWEDVPDINGLDIEDWIEEGATAEEIMAAVVVEARGGKTENIETFPGLVAKIKAAEEAFGYQSAQFEFELHQIARAAKLPRNSAEAIYLKSCGERFEPETISLRDFLAKKSDPREYLVGGLLPKASTVLFYADGGIGKTLFAYDLVRSIFDKDEFLGHPIAAQPKTLLIQTDESEDDARERMRDSFAEGSPALDYCSITTFWTFSSLDWLERRIKNEGLELVVIDSFASANQNALTEEKDATHAAVLYKLRDLSQQYGCTFMVIHHTNKKGQSRGSTAMRNNVSECWHLRKYNPEIDSVPIKPNERVFCVEKSRSGNNKHLVVEITEDGTFELVGDLEKYQCGTPNAPANWTEKILLYFQSNPTAEVSAWDLVDFEIFRGLKIETAKKALQRHAKRGVIKRVGEVFRPTGPAGSVYSLNSKSSKKVQNSCPSVPAQAETQVQKGIDDRDSYRDTGGTRLGHDSNTNAVPVAEAAVPDGVSDGVPVLKLSQGGGFGESQDTRTDKYTREDGWPVDKLAERLPGALPPDRSALPINPYSGPAVGDVVEFTCEDLTEAQLRKLRSSARELPWGSHGTVVDVDYTTKRYFVVVETGAGERYQVDNFTAIRRVIDG